MKRIFFLFGVLFFSLVSFSQSDTLNQIDSLGQKQGYWIIYGKDKPGKGVCDTCKIEEGPYLNNRKNGEWIIYHKDGVTPRLIGVFINGRPNGGWVKIRSYTNEYDSGCPKSALNFNKNGKQHGINILYYDCDSLHPNLGQIEVKYKMNNGEKIDTLYRYYRNGDLKQYVIYNADHSVKSVKNFNRVNPVVKQDYTEQIDSNNLCKSWLNGELYFEGECRNGKIWTGKKYVYDSDGILLKIEIWKEGKYYGAGKL